MRPVRRVARIAALSAPLLALSLGACSSISSVTSAVTPDANSSMGKFLRGTSAEPTTIDMTQFEKTVTCPRVQILPETHTLRVTFGGTEYEPGVVRYQATIADTARECVQGSDGKIVKVGVAGRALSGPRGSAGTIKLPLRIVVQEGDTVTYSKLHTVSVNLTDSDPSQKWAFVQPDIAVTDPDRAKILVGFDDKGR